MTGETPVPDTLADITAISVERCALPPRELMLARIAALIAVDAPAASYSANAGAAAPSGITPMAFRRSSELPRFVGTVRVVGAPGNILKAFGFEIMVAEAEMTEAAEAGQ